jgi:hypothetical protein
LLCVYEQFSIDLYCMFSILLSFSQDALFGVENYNMEKILVRCFG